MSLAPIAALLVALADPVVGLEVDPAESRLVGSEAASQVLVTGLTAEGRRLDLTEAAEWVSDRPEVVTVGPAGRIRPAGDGAAAVEVRAGGHTAQIRVTVEDFANTRPVRFDAEIVPLFTRLGCNSGACHGKASGQNGFRLSLLGFDPQFDYDALVREGRGRRVLPGAPEASLLLAKPSGSLPHGGGVRLKPGSPEYQVLRRWVLQGMPRRVPGADVRLVRIEVHPERRRIERHARQQLRTVAHYDDGSQADVTHLAQYQTNAPDLAEVDEQGTLRTLDGVGEAAVMARFGGQVAVSRATVPVGGGIPAWEAPASTHLIDPFVFGKLRDLGLPPSPACTDAEFARRSALDICGLLPTPEEVIAFEGDTDPEKRAKWVDRLLERPEYADFFAMKWSAILRNKRTLNFGPNGDPNTFAFHAWIRQALAEDLPYDRFAEAVLAARGDPAEAPPVAWYRLVGKTREEQVDDTAQLFLGLRIQCARCHHHPFEVWSQDDYYGFAAFFARVGRKAGDDPVTPRVYLLPTGMATDPVSKKQYAPRLLGGPELADLGPRDDPRLALAAWLRREDNPFFARALVNRYWKHFFGRGLVEPEDDLRATNPPSNPELLDALAADLIRGGYSLKRLVRTIATSRAYDRSSEPTEANVIDRQNFARYYPKRLPAEVLLDAVDAVTGATERFNGLPRGLRAVQLPDEGFNSAFLDVFGRPKRESVCECERSAEPSLSQSLHLLNSGEVQQKLSGGGRTARWAANPGPDEAKVEDLYRLCYARPPTPDEREVCLAHLDRRRAAGRLRQGYEDLLWALINTKEFLFNH